MGGRDADVEIIRACYREVISVVIGIEVQLFFISTVDKGECEQKKIRVRKEQRLVGLEIAEAKTKFSLDHRLSVTFAPRLDVCLIGA